MNELPLQHGVAARWATIMLGATALAGALTLGVFLLPRPEPPPLELANAGGASAPKPPRRLPTEGIATNWSRVGASVDGINAPAIDEWKKDRAAEEARIAADLLKNKPASPGDENHGPFALTWRYLGAIIEGDRKTALIVAPEADGQQRQRFISEGFKKDEYTVIGIEPTKLIIQQGKTRHELPITASTRGQAIAAGSSTPPAVNTRPGGIPLPASVVPASALPANRGGVSERSRDLLRPPKMQPNSPPGVSPAVQPGTVQPLSPDQMSSPMPPPEPPPPGIN